MRQLTKNFLCGVLLASGLQVSWGFSLLGPTGNGGDAWQVPTIGYGIGGDIGSPKNLGEEYRRNIRVMYYTMDANFLDYFGSNGVVAIDQAMAIMNSVSNVNSYSSGLTEFPLNSQAVNYQASALGLYDLKSAALGLMIEQMGLAEPERYTWTLHNRYLLPNTTCPLGEEYLVVQRNYDITASPLNQVQYSPYVNGTLYSYLISEACTGPNPLAVTVPFSVDPLADTFTAVAGNGDGLSLGGFYYGLTRDDVAGLRYLWSTNNINTESAAAGSLLTTSTTNLNSSSPFPANPNGAYGGFGTFDLSALLLAASTNDPVTLTALFPGLVVASTKTNFIQAQGQTVVSYFTNLIGSPIGSPPLLVVKTNYYNYPLTVYVDTFANVITNHYYASTVGYIVTSSLGSQSGAPLGSPLVTNVTIATMNITLPTGGNLPSGDYYLLPTNLCGMDIIQPPIFTTNVATTTILTSATNDFNGTNFFYTQNLVTYSKQYTYTIHPVTCTTSANATGLYQGIGDIKFVKASFDSLLGQYFQPITNNYSMVSVTNSRTYVQNFQRIVTAPDFLFTAADLTAGPGGIPAVPYGDRNINFNVANVYPQLAGPGTIDPSTRFTFNKSGIVYQNGPLISTNAFLSEATQSQVLAWGSFDGSTNDPVVYPNGTSIVNLENQVLVQISPVSLPNGTKNVPYPATTFTATGGSFLPPFTWTLAAGLGGLPTGLILSSNGMISGTPTQSGTFDFVIQLNDSLTPPRTVQWNYSITIP